MSKNWFKTLTAILSLVITSILVVGVVYALQPSNTNLVGTWINVNPNTRSIVKIIITDNGAGGTRIHAYGSCTPTSCDWGTVPGITYSKSVSQSVGNAFTATYKSGFAIKLVTGNIVVTASGPRLKVITYTRFTDGSNRYNYYSSDTFYKE